MCKSVEEQGETNKKLNAYFIIRMETALARTTI